MTRLIISCLAVLASLPNILTASSAGHPNFDFDYIVIGGGTAGLVVAERLSEDAGVTVAVIEAGLYHPNEPLINTPALMPMIIGDPALDWRYVTTPQPYLYNATVMQPRGKALGGTSAINGMIWDRASQKEYDAWEELGATGWNWNSLLPYFKKSETVAPPSQAQLDPFPGASLPSEADFAAFHGSHGPIQASYDTIYSDVVMPYVQASNNLGMHTNSDPDNGNATGIYNTERSVDRVKNVGKRSYSASTYFNMSSGRPNFKAFLGTQATKINLDPGHNARATSVDMVAVNSTGFTGRIHARKEVILSAGVFGTPQILELSGIGNPEVLGKAGIEVVVNLPAVGENLQDHVASLANFEVNSSLFTWDVLRNNATFAAMQEAEYAANGTGLLADPPSLVTFTPLKTLNNSHLVASVWDEATKLINAPETSPLARRQYIIERDWLVADDVATIELLMYPAGGDAPGAPVRAGAAYVSVEVVLIHPFSRGSVHINTSDPLAYPLIDPRYLSNDVDRQLAFKTAKLSRTIMRTEPLSALVVADHWPTATNVSTDADWEEFVKRNALSFDHPVGTAAMLPRELGGVVDPLTLKVYGTDNVRVVDASLMPLHIAAHPQRTIYAIAERASDIIRRRICG